MILENVRVPRSHLLGKYGTVDDNGNYISAIKNWDMRFGMHMSALSSGRAMIAFTINIFNALTIALRYSHTRKQF
jgi:acyl-CoA oxidase